jgi:hypothetical protein
LACVTFETDGDVVGATFDIDAGVIQFYLNGKDLGVAFRGNNKGRSAVVC